jgi:hypothetical protein
MAAPKLRADLCNLTKLQEFSHAETGEKGTACIRLFGKGAEIEAEISLGEADTNWYFYGRGRNWQIEQTVVQQASRKRVERAGLKAAYESHGLVAEFQFVQ